VISYWTTTVPDLGIKSITLSSDSNLTLYTGYMLLYRPISTSVDYVHLHEYINRIGMWANANCLQFNIEKCKWDNQKMGRYMATSIISSSLQEVEPYRYLRILLSSDLSWTRHIPSLCSKARKLIGLIYCRFYQHSSPESLLQMYLTLVRPHLEYASQVWNTSKIGEIDSFEKVQKFTLRVYSKQWNSGYDELLQLFSLPTLQQCRLYLHLSIM